MSGLCSAEIRHDESGFTVAAAGSSLPALSLKWTEVKTILAYKRDAYAMDLICLEFVTDDGTIEVNEHMHGWSQLVERLPSLVPGTPPFSDWWERVAQPPFALCMTTLFQRV